MRKPDARPSARAKAYARQTWKDRDDTAGVHRALSHGRPQPQEAPRPRPRPRRIVRKIKSGKVHPHPDRTWSSSQDLADARKDWERRSDPRSKS